MTIEGAPPTTILSTCATRRPSGDGARARIRRSESRNTAGPIPQIGSVMTAAATTARPVIANMVLRGGKGLFGPDLVRVR